MDQTRVLYRVENRQIYLELEENTYFCLESTFLDFCKSDTCLSERLIEFFPIFNYKNALFNNVITELLRNQPILDKQEVIVEWSPLKLQQVSKSTAGKDISRSRQRRVEIKFIGFGP